MTLFEIGWELLSNCLRPTSGQYALSYHEDEEYAPRGTWFVPPTERVRGGGFPHTSSESKCSSPSFSPVSLEITFLGGIIDQKVRSAECFSTE